MQAERGAETPRLYQTTRSCGGLREHVPAASCAIISVGSLVKTQVAD